MIENDECPCEACQTQLLIGRKARRLSGPSCTTPWCMNEPSCDNGFCTACVEAIDTMRAKRANPAAAPQPTPTGDGVVVLNEVVRDLQDRAAMGHMKYGTKLRTHNGRNALLDAYQEALDLAMYLKQALMEQEDA